jgi:nucleoside-diphosphate-sugar epimerase
VYEDEDKFLNPQSPYAESKINIENYLKENVSNYLILRFGTIFGISEGMRFHTAINKFCYEASLGRPLTIWKQNYKQYRPYLGLKDAVRALNQFLRENYWNETYNVLTGNYKLKDIIKSISEIVEINLNMVDTPLLNQFSYKVSDEKIKNIGFEPNENLNDNIIKTLRTLRNLK